MNKRQPIRIGALRLALAIFWGALAVSGQSQTANVSSTLSASGRKGVSTQQPDADQPQLQRRNPRYRIHHSDTLSITFPLSPEFDQPKVTVQPDGYVNLHGANSPSLHIEGMTVPEVVDALKKSYAGILHEPIINVDLIDFQKPYFLVSGQVGKPGEYELRHDTTITEAIAMAGGFAPSAKTQVFFYHRVSPDWVEVRQFNVKDILRGKNVNEDARLAPGDMVFVPEKFITRFRKYVPYGIGTGFGLY